MYNLFVFIDSFRVIKEQNQSGYEIGRDNATEA